MHLGRTIIKGCQQSTLGSVQREGRQGLPRVCCIPLPQQLPLEGPYAYPAGFVSSHLPQP